MKAAIIGGGFAANIHASALQACGVELRAVVTSREETARSFAKKWKIPSWGTDSGLALHSEIDAVHICTPPPSHIPLIKMALQSGKHVLCEKPLCYKPEEALALAEVAEQNRQNFVTEGDRFCFRQPQLPKFT